MRNRWLFAVLIVGLFGLAQGVRAEKIDRVGLGLNYWRMLDDIDVDEIDENGVSYLVTYQHKVASFLRLEADLEVFPDGFQGVDGSSYAPQAYVVLGLGIYAAVGVGIVYGDGDWANEPFYALRAGLDIEAFPQLYLDLNLNYRFGSTTDLSDPENDIDADTMTLGAALRYQF